MRASATLLSAAIAASVLAGACRSAVDKTTSPTPVASTPSPGNRGPSPERPTVPPPGGTCVAANARSFIGQRASSELLERARVAAQAGTARFIRPKEPITTEYLGSRLNLQLDAGDIVQGVSCG